MRSCINIWINCCCRHLSSSSSSSIPADSDHPYWEPLVSLVPLATRPRSHPVPMLSVPPLPPLDYTKSKPTSIHLLLLVFLCLLLPSIPHFPQQRCKWVWLAAIKKRHTQTDNSNGVPVKSIKYHICWLPKLCLYDSHNCLWLKWRHLILLTRKTNIQPLAKIENYSLNLSSLMKRKKKIMKRKIMWSSCRQTMKRTTM